MSLRERVAQIASGDVSPVDVTEEYLERISSVDDRVRAFSTLDGEGAMRQAHALTEGLRAGREPKPLHGIPVGIKDLVDVKGMRTLAGSRLLEASVARRDAWIASCLRAAGAVIVGKTNTHELAYGVVTPPTANPWNLSRIPGGSSGGSAAAVAARMVAAAMGTDTVGSIRGPSALCGVSGLRPRRGFVPMTGIIPLAPSLDTCGPIADDAADLELLWGAIEGPRFTSRPAGAFRIAAPSRLSDVFDCDHEVEEAVEVAIESMCRAGSRRIRRPFGPLREWDRPANLILMAEALAVHRARGWYPARADRYSRGVLGSLRYAERIRAEELLLARREMERLTTGWQAVMSDVDLVILPASPIAAPPPPRDVEEERSLTLALTRPSLPASMCGLPSIAVPCGFSKSGLPLGMQCIARDEATALSAARRYQELTDFHMMRPVL